MLVKTFRKTHLALAVSASLLQGAAFAYESPVHVFSVDDVMGDFQGSTFGTAGLTQDKEIICGIETGTKACPPDNPPIVDKAGVTLYPVDSLYGYYVVDFLGAQDKTKDYDYREGFVGNIMDGTEVIGIKVSNAPTDKYKVKPPLGTWCQGLGGTSVKCETEHYTVLEHVLSCYETIPYQFADPLTGLQKVLMTPDGELTYDCANAPLDDNVRIIEGGVLTETRLVNSTPCDDDDPELACQMYPNDKTDMLNNVGLSADYSVQLKDDGKPLYGWGGVHKRPNDVRMYARLALPDAWKVPGADYEVTKAQLVVSHWITNNPNDQLRPEDLENEAATGRKPDYLKTGEGDSEVWKSLADCYEGDGDFIEGDSGPTPIGAGTVLKNMPFALAPDAEPGEDAADDPYAFSSDLRLALTNAYYTTINRDPFEWSYVNTQAAAAGTYEFIGSATPLSDAEMAAQGLELVSGPRWRLKPNKFGQDLPGLEIPLIECSPPPFKSDNIKYEVGLPTTTVINLLDWDTVNKGPSPLATSKGWVDVTTNGFVTVAGNVNGVPYTSNGLPMTDDFDLAVYIKGDAKSTAIYNARLIIEYVGDENPPPSSYDLALSVAADGRVISGTSVSVDLTVENIGIAAAADKATVNLAGVTNRGTPYNYSVEFTNLSPGAPQTKTYTVPLPAWSSDKSTKIDWTATVTSAEDTNPTNDSATAKTQVKKQ